MYIQHVFQEEAGATFLTSIDKLVRWPKSLLTVGSLFFPLELVVNDRDSNLLVAFLAILACHI